MLLNNEFISKIDGKYKIHRVFDGKDIDFGTFNTLDEAIKYRDELDDDGWPIPLSESEDYSFSEKYIKKLSENKFIVFNEINNKEKTFGPYNSIEMAKIARRNLLSNGWESDLEFSRAKYTKYIRKEGNNFVIVKQIKGEFHKFGTFKSLEEAKKSRNELVDSNWGEFHILKDDSLKYIAYNGKNFQVQKSVNGKIIIFGRYEELNDAIIARNKFVEENWSVVPKVTSFVVKRNTNIYTTRSGFSVCKRINGEFKIFDTFDNLEEALNFRDLLKENNWNINKIRKEVVEDAPSFSEEYINFDGEYYTIERLFHDGTRVYDVLKNKNLAIKKRDKILAEGWPNIYAFKSKKYPYGENIVPFDFIFNIEKEIGDELLEFGPFYSFESAINERLKLVENNWNMETKDKNIDNISFDEIKDIYQSVNLINEPEISFPQADGMDDIIKLAEKLYVQNSLNKSQIMEFLNVKTRHYSFIISAGQYLGIFERNIGIHNLSAKGKEIFSLSTRNRNLKIVCSVLEHKPFYDVFTKYLETKLIPTSDEIFEILKNNYIYNVNSDVTLRRRASSVRTWITWIVDLID